MGVRLTIKNSKDPNAKGVIINAMPGKDGRVRVSQEQTKKLMKIFGITYSIRNPFGHLAAFDQNGNGYQVLAWYE
jgi:hypothetical protein